MYFCYARGSQTGYWQLHFLDVDHFSSIIITTIIGSSSSGRRGGGSGSNSSKMIVRLIDAFSRGSETHS